MFSQIQIPICLSTGHSCPKQVNYKSIHTIGLIPKGSGFKRMEGYGTTIEEHFFSTLVFHEEECGFLNACLLLNLFTTKREKWNELVIDTFEYTWVTSPFPFIWGESSHNDFDLSERVFHCSFTKKTFIE